MPNHAACWCGNTELVEFSDDYRRCPKCETLVVAKWPDRDLSDVKDNDDDLYGKTYAERHLHQSYGLPEFTVRARNDLPERCAHWLRTLLRYRLPPASLLEVGSFHGAFVGLAKLAGYEARGLDISPALAQQAMQRFGIEVLSGPLEQQQLAAKSLDVIALFDVLEHLQSPPRTLAAALQFLKPDGLLVIQTPRYCESLNLEQMAQAQPRFANHYKPIEHLLLFSQSALKRLLQQVGFRHLRFEPAIFADYDQFVFASRAPFEPIREAAIAQALESTPHGRMAQAILDAAALADRYCQEAKTANERLAAVDAESRSRIEQINTLTQLVREHDQLALTRAGQIETLEQAVHEARHEHERYASSAHQQIQQLEQTLAAETRSRAEAERAAAQITSDHLAYAQEARRQIEQLQQWLAAEQERNRETQRLAADAAAEHHTFATAAEKQIAQLTAWLEAERQARAEAERAAAQITSDHLAYTQEARRQIEQLQQWLAAEQERNRETQRLAADAAAEHQAFATAAEKQIAQLTAWLEAERQTRAEAERVAAQTTSDHLAYAKEAQRQIQQLEEWLGSARIELKQAQAAHAEAEKTALALAARAGIEIPRRHR